VTNFEFALSILWPEEGKFSNTPGDRGGRTMYGVTQKVFDEWRTFIGNQHADVSTITQEEAQDLYQRMFWRKAHCDDMPKRLGTMVFDIAVNSGPHTAIVLLQRAVGANDDGQWGDQTKQRVDSATSDSAVEDNTLRTLTVFRSVFEEKVIEAHPEDEQFRHGWDNRFRNLLNNLLAANAA
jgi:lysozyme family protein